MRLRFGGFIFGGVYFFFGGGGAIIGIYGIHIKLRF